MFEVVSLNKEIDDLYTRYINTNEYSLDILKKVFNNFKISYLSYINNFIDFYKNNKIYNILRPSKMFLVYLANVTDYKYILTEEDEYNVNIFNNSIRSDYDEEKEIGLFCYSLYIKLINQFPIEEFEENYIRL